jgi:hypothetical protein
MQAVGAAPQLARVQATAEGVAQLADAFLENNLVNITEAPNRTYRSDWKKYKEWVADHRHNNIIPPGVKYLQQAYVDLYFHEIVAHKKVGAPTARRILNSLQWYANNVEHVVKKITLESPKVEVALHAHLHKQKERLRVSYKDPHFGVPTNVLTQLECTQLVRAAINTTSWRPLTTAFTGCVNIFARMDSYLKFSLPDLILVRAHGPIENDGSGNLDSLALGYILQAQTHKDNSFDKRVAGAWRHRQYIRCASGMLAFNLFTRLYNNHDLHFLAPPHHAGNPQPPEWHLFPLVEEWSNQNAADKAYRRLYNLTGLHWDKVTHFRKLGMEYASSRDELLSHAISGLSKHNIGKVARYITELPPVTLKVMADFKADEDYFVPRTQLEPPFGMSREQLTQVIFPQINDWREQRESPAGDHGPAAHNFLYCVLPYLAMIIVQDGIYWIHDYPDHEASRLLLHTMRQGNFVRWAADARQECVRRVNERDITRVADLNLAAQGAFDHVCRTVALLDHKVEEVKRAVAVLDHKVEEVKHDVEAAISHSEQIVMNELADLRQLFLHRGGGGRAGGDHDEDEGDGDGGDYLAMCEGTAPAGNEKLPCRQVNTALSSKPIEPGFPDALPKSMHQILTQHQTFRLSKFENQNKSHWSKKRQVAFSKRLFMFERIKEQARQLRGDADFTGVKLPRAAALLDRKKGSMSVDKYRKLLQSQLSKKRKPRGGI